MNEEQTIEQQGETVKELSVLRLCPLVSCCPS